MITFIIAVALVFIAVELFVRLVVDPWISGKNKKVSKSPKTKFDPTIKLATETMYDGGEPHTPDASENTGDKKNISKDDVKS